MTRHVDRIWIQLGVDERELKALSARRYAYLGMVMIAGLSTCLLAATVSNLVGSMS